MLRRGGELPHAVEEPAVAADRHDHAVTGADLGTEARGEPEAERALVSRAEVLTGPLDGIAVARVVPDLGHLVDEHPVFGDRGAQLLAARREIREPSREADTEPCAEGSGRIGTRSHDVGRR